MAEIVLLNSWREQRGRRPEIRIGEQPDEGSAQLLLFTGIRYERLDGMAMQPASAKPLLAEQN